VVSSTRFRGGLLAAALACVACAGTSRRNSLDPLPKGESGVAILCGKIVTADDEDQIFDRGMILVRGGKIAYVGERCPIPAGYTALELEGAWATPGMVELHSHIQSGGFGDINDMVIPVNPELRASAGLRPGNPLVKRACAGGVTTLFGIPGSGTSNSGFGVIYKTKTRGTYDEVVVRDPGGMKIAQSYNPERGSGDLGQTRAGLTYILNDLNHKALGEIEERHSDPEHARSDPALANLVKVHEKELPVLIHCAGSDGVPSAARMWKLKYDTRCVLSHGCFDAHRTAPWLVAAGAPINAGPRTIDFITTHDGKITGTAQRYLEAGAKDLSLNTDSPVVPEEELFLQGSVSARYGADAYTMLRACTIHPARVFGIADRVGSLEPGKDADIVLRRGDPLDPRARVEIVLIDGRVEYDARDGQWF
jgi:imidazolonepropionase-like amidohydrolase